MRNTNSAAHVAPSRSRMLTHRLQPRSGRGRVSRSITRAGTAHRTAPRSRTSTTSAPTASSPPAAANAAMLTAGVVPGAALNFTHRK